MALIGKIIAMTGTASLISNNGNQRDLKLGDNIQTADTIKTGAGVEVDLQLANGQVIHIGAEQLIAFADELVDAFIPASLDASVDVATIDTVVKAIEDGKDISEVLEETAAGPGGSSNSYGFSFVDLVRINDDLNNFRFAYEFGSVTPGDTAVSGNSFADVINQEDAAEIATDSSPVAVNDSASITEDAAPNTVSGTVLSNDTVGADSNATPISAYSGNLTYGSLVLNSDGTYSYTLNNANPAVNALNNGQTLIDSHTYTLTDGDGTTTTAVLNITINGNTDGAPSVSIPDTNGLAAGDSTLPETAGATAGSFSVSTPAGLASISVGGTTVTEAQLGNLGSSPVSINTGEGTLILTGYNAGTGVVSYTYDPNVQSVNGNVTDSIAISVTDDLGATSPINNLDIVITDSSPVAVNDSASITEDAAPNTVSGTVLSNDTVGADSNATPPTQR
ncbi:MAG: hypothetical protein CTY32_01795 [Methylotenera sp.]|nr:MAG: hypothetical protein CTY32_01795 [Methylotenera sp.]